AGAFGYTSSNNTSHSGPFSATTHVTSGGATAGNTAAVTIAGTGVATAAAPPTIAKSFNNTHVFVGETALLTFTLGNPAGNTVALTGVGFTDTLPAGLFADNQTAVNTCGGTVSVVPGSGISL